MKPFRDMRLSGAFRIELAAPDDFEGWRDAARRMVRADVPPDRVVWESPADQRADLFAHGDRRLPSPPADAPQPRVSRDFLQLAQSVILHSESTRFSLLYRTLWRLQSRPRLMEDKADPDVRAMEDLARQVRRDIHKMRAFVRFRLVEGEGVESEAGDSREGEHYVAWFEPEHHILRANAGFFVRRFTAMHWAILTPDASVRWDGQQLHTGPGAQRSDAPPPDAGEALWLTYYRHIFNPARLKLAMMKKEMPTRYWHNLPEAALITELAQTAHERSAKMVEAEATVPRRRIAGKETRA